MFFSGSILKLHIAASIAQALVFERQVPVVSVNPISFVPATPSNTVITSSPTTTITATTVITSTTTVPPSTPRITVTFTPSGLASPITETIVAGLSIHGVPTPAVPSVPQPASESNSSNKGAIAGGVLGGLAVIVAALAAFIWFRRRSARHWRNRTVGRWQTADDKDATAGTGIRSVYVGEPVYGPDDVKRPVPNPLPPLYIRDRHSAADPLGDAPSPTSPQRSHARRGSIASAAHQRHESSGHFDIELQPTSPNK